MARRTSTTETETETTEATGLPEGDLAQANPGPSGAPSEDGAAQHQEDAPADLVEAVDKAEDAGFIGTPVSEKPDYSQANSAVMNGGS